MRDLGKYQIDIAALSETRFAGVGSNAEPKGGYTFFWRGKVKDDDRIHGVGLAATRPPNTSERANDETPLPTQPIPTCRSHQRNNWKDVLGLHGTGKLNSYFFEFLC